MVPVMPPELIVALDTDDLETARHWVARLGPVVTWFKVGLELFSRHGPSACRLVTEAGAHLFLDLKIHDIPATAAGAVRSARQLGAAMTTLHASGGRAMLEAARAEAAGSQLRLAAVTVLTSLDAPALVDIGWSRSPAEQVLHLAELAVAAGLEAAVCSPHEIGLVRGRFGNRALQLVVPGIRPAEHAQADDQKRTLGPAAAVRAGADFLVVGRPITRASDPFAAAARIRNEIGQAVSAPPDVSSAG